MMMNVPQQSRSAKIDNIFVGDGEYSLCLRIGELIELQEKTRVGPFALSTRLSDGNWFVEDIRETIRLSLIGGGMDHQKAYLLIDRYVSEGSLMNYVGVAQQAVFAALMGVNDEAPEVDDADPMTTSAATDSSVGVDYSSSEAQPDIQSDR